MGWKFKTQLLLALAAMTTVSVALSYADEPPPPEVEGSAVEEPSPKKEAEEDPVEEEADEPAPRPRKTQNRRRSDGFKTPTGATLHTISLGYAKMAYPSFYRSYRDLPGTKAVPGLVELALFRTFFKHDTGLGVSLNYADEYSYTDLQIFGQTLKLQSRAQRLFVGASFRQALGTNLMRGVNLRADLGYGRYILTSELDSAKGMVMGKSGPGLLLGLSYAFRVRPETWLQSKANDNYYMELYYQVSALRLDPSVPGVHSIGLTFGF
ncbi:MAG: hypothetical protein KGQ59_11050 [Bdellovibrionales bacterium]|nr:hypothetical protein [Bdellovibrionales bacterium]